MPSYAGDTEPNSSVKILHASNCEATFGRLTEAGRKIVLSHGVFDLIHPGHIAHLQEAKSLGDVLVVSVISAPNVNRGPGRPVFSDELRSYALASLACVDYVVLSDDAAGADVIESVRPAVFCTGRDEAGADAAHQLAAEQVEELGGSVHFTDDAHFSSTQLINDHLEGLPLSVKSYTRQFVQQFSIADVRAAVERMRDLKVLVLGDVIIDRFAYCRIQGLTSKGSVVSARFEREEQHLGGSLAIARHVAAFCDSVTVSAVIGCEPEVHSSVLHNTNGGICLDLIYDDRYPTVSKQRFIAQQGIRDEFTKLLSVNQLDMTGPPSRSLKELYGRLASTLADYDLVILCDFGHGLIDDRLMDLVQTRAPFLALNCQTNSANHGYNLITKYSRADSFCLDEKELRLAYASRNGDPSELLTRLQRHLNSKHASWLTLGSQGSLGRDGSNRQHEAPAFTLHVKDTTGAGDAFFAVASLCARLELPLEIGSLLGNLAGATIANVLGNSEPIDKARLLEFASTVLKTRPENVGPVSLSLYPRADNENAAAPTTKTSPLRMTG